ncbi:probable serine/threonine-protein kinase PBL26 isoform X1 [Cucurbita moschata]|uniref:Probable serine/threonine-protein kinase PBL26 isoform X1 n=1 Tax=Cucurbita moschata TaxID=3662 RepID=A0A6J1FW59_CUCMO|nr:probable serine/threonine-protein kinase PBL26 isoform X1 [Cucurbita moschata]
MTVDHEDSEAIEKKKKKKKKNVLVGIRINGNSRDLLNWAIVKVADPGDCVIVIHVCQTSDRASKDKPLFDEFIEGYKRLCDVNKVALIAQISTGSSVKKTLVRQAKSYAAGAVVLGTSKPSNLGGWSSTIRYVVKRLPRTTDVLALNNGKIVFRRSTNDQLPGLNLDPKPSLSQASQSDFDGSETEKSVSYGVGSEDLKDEFHGVVLESKRVCSKQDSPMKKVNSEPGLGWPLLRTSPRIPQTPCVHNMSVVQWVMNLPDRSPFHSLSIKGNDPSRSEISGLSAFSEPPGNLEDLLKTISTSYKWFSPDVLKASTSHFSSENLIGKGGCNRVYKGILPDGKPIAVKVMNFSKQAWNDFSREVDIISSLHHKNITPFLGICIEHDTLISVYDFFSKGSLEENLYDRNKEKGVLSWEVRFEFAIGIAEALNYLHDECPQPVVHRDVKTSNILLTDELEPQLSDFGLATWGPTESSFRIEADVVGTFGYLAPEYFMYGKMSNKIDVYAFGIVLLELLSGRRAISTETSKEQQSLVMWAKPMIENGNVKNIVDPNLEGKFNDEQLQRMVLAATLCITRASRLRPRISQILKILRGESKTETENIHMEDSQSVENGDDEVYPNSSSELHLSLALVGVDDDNDNDGDDSFSSVEQRKRICLEDYLKARWSRSSSFNQLL